jgi:hypothetical protein
MGTHSDVSSGQDTLVMNDADSLVSSRVVVTFRGGRGTLHLHRDGNVQLEHSIKVL